MSEHVDMTSPDDARVALSAVSAMKAAAARRAAWPLWLSLSVALAYGAQGVVLTSGLGGVTRGILDTAVGLSGIAAVIAVVLVQRFRGVSLWRVSGVRLGSAVAIHLVALFGTGFVRDEIRLDGAGPLIFGAIEALAILAAFALIALAERAMPLEDGFLAKTLTRRVQRAPTERNRLSEDGR